MPRTPRTPRPVRTLGPLLATVALAAAVLTGCGSATSSAGSPASGIQTQGPSAGPIQGATVLPLISLTGGGGRPSTTASLLATPAQIGRFTSQLRAPLARHIQYVVDRAKESGYLVYGAVVAVGCDRPPGASVALDEQGEVVITPGEVASPLPECLAPVTSVAIATVPGAQ